MNILKEINISIKEFEIKFGYPGQKLYLGRNEFYFLKDYAEKNSDIKINPVEHDERFRAEYFGMKLYLVDSDSYISVGL